MPMGMKNCKPVYMNGPNSVIRNNNNAVRKDSKGRPIPNKSSNSKNLSITPLPSRRSQTSKPQVQPSMKQGIPANGSKKGGFVMCEICDGYIHDLEQLRNNMQWIYKVHKISTIDFHSTVRNFKSASLPIKDLKDIFYGRKNFTYIGVNMQLIFVLMDFNALDQYNGTEGAFLKKI